MSITRSNPCKNGPTKENKAFIMHELPMKYSAKFIYRMCTFETEVFHNQFKLKFALVIVLYRK